jgi:hypothetical protein
MVMQRKSKRLASVLHLGGHGNVSVRRGGVARGVVVHQDQGAGVQFKRALDDFTWVDGNVVNGAFGLFLIGDQDVLSVKKRTRNCSVSRWAMVVWQ